MTSDGRILNAVQWDETWPYEEGVAMQLSGNSILRHPIQAKKLVLGYKRLLAMEIWGLRVQTILLVMVARWKIVPEKISDAKPVAPSMGDVIFTEALLDSKMVSDQQGEWVG